MRLTYDPEADALYLKIGTAEIDRTDEVAPNVMIDLDSSGDLVGIEVLGVSQRPGAEPFKIDFELLVRDGSTVQQALEWWRRMDQKVEASAEAAE